MISRAIADVHDRAVREFFRPEFFNRIDGVLSFERLSPETLESIAWMQFKEILRRDGLQRRSVLIDIEPDAIRRTAARGYDPAMGARALKRQIERDLVRPAAEVLAASPTDQATLLRIFLDGDQVQTRWQRVDFAERSDPMPAVHDRPVVPARRKLLRQGRGGCGRRSVEFRAPRCGDGPKLARKNDHSRQLAPVRRIASRPA